jgi:hypothetical protein
MALSEYGSKLEWCNTNTLKKERKNNGLSYFSKEIFLDHTCFNTFTEQLEGVLSFFVSGKKE